MGGWPAGWVAGLLLENKAISASNKVEVEVEVEAELGNKNNFLKMKISLYYHYD